MGRILHPLFALFVSVTHQNLARQVADLKAEIRILPERQVATDQERRRLLRLGKQARNFVMAAEDLNLAPQYVMIDNDTKTTSNGNGGCMTIGNVRMRPEGICRRIASSRWKPTRLFD